MARLPETLDQPGGPPQGVRPSTNVVTPTDLGLGNAAQALAGYAEQRQQRIDLQNDRQATEMVTKAQAEFQPKFDERAAAYDGRTPGFASQNILAFDDHFQPLLADPTLSEGVRSALQRRIDGLKTEFGQQAIAAESAKRAAIVDEQVKVKRSALTGQQLVGFNDAFGKRYQALADGYDGSQPDFQKGVVAAFDEEAQKALAAAPAEVRDDVAQALNAKRVETAAHAMQVEDEGHDAFVVTNAKVTVNQIANGVISNPASYQNAQADLDRAAAGVPGHLRPAFLREAKGDVATARIEGLIDRRDLDTAKAELKGGTLDAVIPETKKQSLLLHIEQQERLGPRTEAEWAAEYSAKDNLQAYTADVAAGRTPAVSLESVVGAFKEPRERAAAADAIDKAREVSIATGNLRTQTEAELQARAVAPPPDPASPDYAHQQRAWELSRKAAASELAARRKDPAQWAMTSTQAGDTGAALQQRWQGFTGAKDAQGMADAGRQYVALSLGLQDRAAVPRAAQRVFPVGTAAELAQSVTKATPEQRPAALRNLAAMVNSLPGRVQMPDGTIVSAREMAARELTAAKLPASALSAVIDLHDDPGKLGLYSDAISNPNAVKPLPGKGDENSLKLAVQGQLAPFMASANATPGSAEENAGREQRVMVTARHLMLSQGLAPVDAAKAATQELTSSYRFVDGWRMPAAQANAPAPSDLLHPFGRQKWQLVRDGLMTAMHDIAAAPGLVYPAPGNPALSTVQAQGKAADIAVDRGRWVTTGDDQGLQLMVPDVRGWTPMADRYGRPITLTWDQAAQLGQRKATYRGQQAPTPGDWLAPPPNAGAPQTVAPARAKAAFAQAIETQESHGINGQTSPKGAMGLRQMEPAAAQDAARRLGVAYDPQRLLTDPAYNRQLSDNHLSWLAQRYDGNVALIAAAYNAGSGKVDQWLAHYDPRAPGHNADDFVAHIPIAQTRNYVRQVLPRALANLQRPG